LKKERIKRRPTFRNLVRLFFIAEFLGGVTNFEKENIKRIACSTIQLEIRTIKVELRLINYQNKCLQIGKLSEKFLQFSKSLKP
jgi:hypothetical protein